MNCLIFWFRCEIVSRTEWAFGPICLKLSHLLFNCSTNFICLKPPRDWNSSCSRTWMSETLETVFKVFIGRFDLAPEQVRPLTTRPKANWPIQHWCFSCFSNLYVEYVVKNPLQCQLVPPTSNPVKKKGQPLLPPDCSPIDSELFATKLDEFVRALPFFA